MTNRRLFPRKHLQPFSDLRMHIGNTCIIYIVVLELAVFVCLCGLPGVSSSSTTWSQILQVQDVKLQSLSNLSTAIYGGKAARRPPSNSGGALLSPIQGAERGINYSIISTIRWLRGSTITGRSLTIAYR